jgi:myo-inositol catabolism protein IolS
LGVDLFSICHPVATAGRIHTLDDMKYRTLGSTGLNVSVVGVGTWQFGGEWGISPTQGDVDAIFDAARSCGINLIDTAECYGDHLSESFVGAAVERDREKWIIATKFGHHFHKPFERTEPRKPADIIKQTDDSLRALRTTWIDLHQYHSWGDDTFFDDDVMATLQKLKEQGKIRHIGNSVSNNRNARQVAASAERGIEAIQIVYNRLDRAPEEVAFSICRDQKLGVLARVPLASGYLSGKYKPGHDFAGDEVRGKWHKQEDRDAKLREVERIGREEVPAGVPMARWALAWCLSDAVVSSVIPGCKTPEQVRENAAAADLL